MPDTSAMSIGEVINLLRDDFPDVSVSKIRFLESQGLVDPSRSPSGYRQFDDDDVAKLRFILKQQRDHFLPLKVIKSKLTVWERGESDTNPMRLGSTHLDESGEPLDFDALIKRSGLTEKQARELMDVGLIKTLPDSEVFPPEAGIVGAEARRLFEQGFEARHLRAIRLSVERESDLLLGMAAPLLKATNAEARAKAKQLLESGSDSVRVMHRALLAAELRQHISS